MQILYERGRMNSVLFYYGKKVIYWQYYRSTALNTSLQ
nr:MAG TPA: hypothetical protein [Caudoviricetes sp.]